MELGESFVPGPLSNIQPCSGTVRLQFAVLHLIDGLGMIVIKSHSDLQSDWPSWFGFFKVRRK